MKLEELKKYKRILILGYGKEGKATEQFLKKYVPDAEIGIADKNLNDNYLNEQINYDLVIKTPGIPKKYITKPYTTATNIFFANISNIVIGVTGTKGKSTTVSLIYNILKNAGRQVFLLGNIGKPMLEELLNPLSKESIFVLELSSYQLDDCNYSPHISVVLDLFPEHMNYHGDVANYYQAKKNIVTYVKNEDYFIYNPRFEELKKWANEIKCFSLPFEETIIDLKNSNLIGEHNLENVRAAITVSHLLEVDSKVIIKSIETFQPLPHRLQKVGTFKKITFYDDAISTTPESTIFAIETLKNIGTIFLGGEDRGFDFHKLVSIVGKFGIANIVIFPDSGDKVLDLIKNRKNYPNILKTKNMEEAVKFAYQNTPKNTVCLLSTASPSYSIWKNFEEKGDLFQRYVKKYGLSK